LDEAIAAEVAAARCKHCGGPLHRGNYQRKPRGALVAAAGEAHTLRHSLCCGRRGCRKRALPPSVRFLGRRVYLGAVVVLASAVAQALSRISAAARAVGVPWRTLRRWGAWWREVLPSSSVWAELRARFVPPPPDETQLPRSLLVRLGADVDGPEAVLAQALAHTARHLAPLTTNSVPEGSRFVLAATATTVVS
jgi:hypothetical protein